MSTPLTIYSTPQPSTRFSEQFFASLDFNNAATLPLPHIQPSDSLHSWTWVSEPFEKPLVTTVDAGDCIPSLDDLKDVIGGLENAYKDGMRAVLYTLYTPFGPRTILAHFSLIRLLVSINNHSPHVNLARATIHRLVEASLLSPEYLERFKHERIMSSSSGFSTATAMPLWELGTLTGENWLRDDILNCRSELMYFCHLATNPLRQAQVLPLTTHFYQEAERLYNQTPRLYSTNLIDIRGRLHTCNFREFTFKIHCDGHWAAYTYDRSIVLQHRDSLSRPPAQGVLEILDWVLEGLALPSPKEIITVVGPQQPVGSGSCGLVAQNFVEHRMDPARPIWTPSQSSQHRDEWLRDMILFHLETAGRGNIREWTRPTAPAPGLRHNPPCSPIPDLAVPYIDYNMLEIQLSHPVFEFLKIPKFATQYIPPGSVRLMPPLDLKSKSFTPVNQLVGLNTFEIAMPPPHTIAAPAGHRMEPESPDSIVDLTQSPLVHSHNFHARALSTISISSTSDEDWNESAPSSESESTLPDPSELWRHTPLMASPRKRRPGTKHRSTRLPKALAISEPHTPPQRSSGSQKMPIMIPDSPSDLSATAHSTQRSRKKLDSIKIERIKTETIKTERIHTQKTAESHAVSVLPSLAPSLGAIYSSFDEARVQVCAFEERRGNKMRIGQSKKRPDGTVKKVTLRCHAYGKHTETHNFKIDPRDHRKGKTIKSGCMAHYNLIAVTGTTMWQLSSATYDHNHDRNLAVGARAPRPVSKQQRQLIDTYATQPSFSRQQIKSIVTESFPSNNLDSRQISNVINSARARARADVEQLGGDFAAIINNLQQKIANGDAWSYSLKLDDSGKVVGLWWQSPTQAALSRRYADILINDNAANRNQYGYPLNIGIIIDNFANSRNIWYALQAREDTAMHSWVLRNHLDAAGSHPEVFVSDRDAALRSVVAKDMPFTYHLFCLHHLEGNVAENLRAVLGESWDAFKNDFWTVYRSVSPEVFEKNWNALTARHPKAQAYLNRELFPCREHWAHPWTSQRFTAGVRTNGRIEGENRVNKALGGPKRTAFDLYNMLNVRTDNQTEKEQVRVREATRKHHDTNLERVFAQPLALLRKYVGPFALHISYREMGLSLFYRVEVLQLPEGHRTWSQYAIHAEQVTQFEWKDGEEKHMRNNFTNDDSFISTAFLIRLITGRGLAIKQLFRIIHLGSSTAHTLALLESGSYVCDCSMGSNLGINCRHYYSALTCVQGMVFQMASIRTRWWQDIKIDPGTIPPVTLTHSVPEQRLELRSLPVSASQFANPLETRHGGPTPPPATQSINARAVFHEAHAALKPLLNTVQTQEQLDSLLAGLNSIGTLQTQPQNSGPSLHDPPVIQHKGRPRSSRLTSAIEGARNGGGGNRGRKRAHPSTSDPAPPSQRDQLKSNPITDSPPQQRRRQNRCGLCGEVGHDRRRCYDVHLERQEDQERQRREERRAARGE